MDDIDRAAFDSCVKLLHEGRVLMTRHFEARAHEGCAECDCRACDDIQEWLERVAKIDTLSDTQP